MADLKQEQFEDLTLVHLKGSLTMLGLEEVQKQFESITHRPGARVVVDLTGVELLTTPAISMFVSAAVASRKTGGHVIFTQTPPLVADVLARLRLNGVLHTVEGLDDALRVAREQA